MSGPSLLIAFDSETLTIPGILPNADSDVEERKLREIAARRTAAERGLPAARPSISAMGHPGSRGCRGLPIPEGPGKGLEEISGAERGFRDETNREAARLSQRRSSLHGRSVGAGFSRLDFTGFVLLHMTE